MFHKYRAVHHGGLLATLIIALFSTPGLAGEWEIGNHVGFTAAAVPGKITYGEKQRFFFHHRRCTAVEHLFSVFTLQPNDFEKLAGRVIVVEFNGEKIGARVLASMEALSGHLVMFTFGTYDKDILLAYLQKSKMISSKLVDGNGLIVSEYFDVLANEWSIEGIEEAFSKAHDMCVLSASE